MHTDVVSNSSISFIFNHHALYVLPYFYGNTCSYIHLHTYVYLHTYVSYGVKCSFTGHTSVPLLLLASYRNLIFQHEAPMVYLGIPWPGGQGWEIEDTCVPVRTYRYLAVVVPVLTQVRGRSNTVGLKLCVVVLCSH